MYLTLLAGANENLRKKWDEKISFIDHPRTAILKKYSRDTVTYPESWNRHLHGSDGKQKETILFVTSVFGVLEYNRMHLKKIRETLEAFLSKKTKSCVIWRPNRNLPEIIMKLRPELFDDFRALLEFYISNDIGVFDELPTPTASIILSDSYLGDSCSVKEVFASTGKPILPWNSSFDKYMLI